MRSTNQTGSGTTGNSIKMPAIAASDTIITVTGRRLRNNTGKNGAMANTPTACIAALKPIILSFIPALSNFKAISGEPSPYVRPNTVTAKITEMSRLIANMLVSPTESPKFRILHL